MNLYSRLTDGHLYLMKRHVLDLLMEERQATVVVQISFVNTYHINADMCDKPATHYDCHNIIKVLVSYIVLLVTVTCHICYACSHHQYVFLTLCGVGGSD